MTIEESSNTSSGIGSKGARIGRAAAWFTAGALGATALTGVAVAATFDADSGEANPTVQAEGRGGPGGKGGPGGPGRHHGGPAGGPMLHSEGVIEDKDGEYRDVASQKGKVTKVTDTSITIESEDDYSQTYVVTDDTRVSKDREDKSIGDIKNGDTVRVVAKKDGNRLTAVRVGAMSPEKAAEMAERREEMRQRFEERREPRQNGETAESGFWGEAPTGDPTT